VPLEIDVLGPKKLPQEEVEAVRRMASAQNSLILVSHHKKRCDQGFLTVGDVFLE
jgi:hypothetical protein